MPLFIQRNGVSYFEQRKITVFTEKEAILK